MKRAEQQAQARLLEEEIDEVLRDLTFAGMKELLPKLAASKAYRKLQENDNRFYRLAFFNDIWLEERRTLSVYGLEEDIFTHVTSLKAVEEKYMSITLALLRFETVMPDAYYEQAIDYLIEEKVSGIAIDRFLFRETAKREELVSGLAMRLRSRGRIPTAIVLLQKAQERYPKNQLLSLELSRCWQAGGCLDQALACLECVEAPGREIQEEMKTIREKI